MKASTTGAALDIYTPSVVRANNDSSVTLKVKRRKRKRKEKDTENEKEGEKTHSTMSVREVAVGQFVTDKDVIVGDFLHQ